MLFTYSLIMMILKSTSCCTDYYMLMIQFILFYFFFLQNLVKSSKLHLPRRFILSNMEVGQPIQNLSGNIQYGEN